MRTESQIFFEETKPFIETLADRVNPQFCLNQTWNYPYLSELINSRDMNMPIADPCTKGPAISIGSGPSLDVCMPFLNDAREKHNAPIFCTASQVWTLHYQGVTPDYVTQHDPWARGCPVCGYIDKTHIRFDDNGDCWCMEGHKIEGADREDLIRGTNIHRWAPEIGCKVLAHPGVQNENLQWEDFKKRGYLYFPNFNPPIGPWPTRDIIRGQLFGAAGEKYLRTYAQVTKSARSKEEIQKGVDEAWQEMITTFVNAPGQHEPQDIPIWQDIILYGEGNPLIKNPIKVAAAFAPSTTFQNAILAFMMGYNPIYFVGYDLCHWQHRAYHHKYFYDGTDRPTATQVPPGEDDRVAMNGFRTDYVQIGEKYALAGYVSKKFHNYYALPGMQLVEVIADGTPGNLEFYPRISVEMFAEGRTVNVPQEKTAKKIEAIVRERKMDKGWSPI